MSEVPTPNSTTLVRIAIPAFNEADRLPVFLEQLERSGVFLESCVEIVVVDDGSECAQGEAMASSVERIRIPEAGASLRMKRLERNRGKGGAVYAAWDEPGEPRMLAFLDSDGAVPAYEVMRLLRLASARPDRALLASRVKMLGRKVERRLKRHLTGRIFASMVGIFIQEGLYDSQCGFKIVPAAAYRRVRPLLQERRFVFDVELVAALLDAGCEVEEAPIDWRDVPGSKVKFFRDALEMFQGVVRISRRRRTWGLADSTRQVSPRGSFSETDTMPSESNGGFHS